MVIYNDIITMKISKMKLKMFFCMWWFEKKSILTGSFILLCKQLLWFVDSLVSACQVILEINQSNFTVLSAFHVIFGISPMYRVMISCQLCLELSWTSDIWDIILSRLGQRWQQNTLFLQPPSQNLHRWAYWCTLTITEII